MAELDATVMWKIVEARHCPDQWYIYRRTFGFWWRFVAVRSGLQRAADAITETKINDDLAATADEVIRL